jgi:hypothetical protein
MNNFRHLLRYGTNAEQKYFTDDLAGLYDGIIINANMAAFSPDAMAIFVVKKTTSKPFIIDPITHAFQHDQSFISSISEDKKKIVIKKSISNLIKNYGDELKDKISESSTNCLLPKKQLEPADIDAGFIDSFTENVLNFQRNISLSKKVDDYKEYLAFSKDGQPNDMELNLKPMFLVAPYFYIDIHDWVEKNIKLIEKSKEKLVEGESLLAQITISHQYIKDAKGNYDGSELKKIIGEYKEQNNVNGYLIWVDGFREHEENSENLSVYLEMVADLKSLGGGVKVYSLYGSYFSTILTNPALNLLDGICHGLEYGEAREVVPVGGGLPVPKFYFYPIHKRVSFFEMFRFLSLAKIELRGKYISEVCDCDTCKSLINSNDVIGDFERSFGESKKSTFQVSGRLVSREFATSQTKDRSLRHYLESKKKEFDFVNVKPIEEAIKQLNESHEKYKDSFGLTNVEHLNKWSKALDIFLQKRKEEKE